jgi:hypothetical protein
VVAEHAGETMDALIAQLEALHQRFRTALKTIDHPDAAAWPLINGTLVSTPERLDRMRDHLQGHLDELRAGGSASH